MGAKLNRIKVVLVNAYCANRLQPNLETLDRIAQVLNVPMRTLVKED